MDFISNIITSYLNTLKVKLKFFDLFNNIIISEEANSAKPSLKFFSIH